MVAATAETWAVGEPVIIGVFLVRNSNFLPLVYYGCYSFIGFLKLVLWKCLA